MLIMIISSNQNKIIHRVKYFLVNNLLFQNFYKTNFNLLKMNDRIVLEKLKII